MSEKLVDRVTNCLGVVDVVVIVLVDQESPILLSLSLRDLSFRLVYSVDDVLLVKTRSSFVSYDSQNPEMRSPSNLTLFKKLHSP